MKHLNSRHDIYIGELDFGIGYSYKQGNDKIILINKHLEKHPKLKQSVINHEIEHLDNSNPFLDIKDMFNLKKGFFILLFCFRHPFSLLSVSPVFISRKYDIIAVNYQMLFTYILFGVVFYFRR